MLRIVECLKECGLSQSAVAKSIGWSRAQVSLTFRRGTFPSDAERFCSGVRQWAEETPKVVSWLVARGLPVEALLEPVVVEKVAGPVDVRLRFGAADAGLLERLRAAAQRERRSIEQQVLRFLDGALGEEAI